MTTIPLGDLPEGRAAAVAGGSVVVIRGPADFVCAFAAHCPHTNQSLDGALAVDGVLTCPHHFWRFELPTGANRTGGPGLEPVPVTVDAGVVTVEAPEPPVPRSFRDVMLDHARTWTRGD